MDISAMKAQYLDAYRSARILTVAEHFNYSSTTQTACHMYCLYFLYDRTREKMFWQY